jgi:hypothetical protein
MKRIIRGTALILVIVGAICGALAAPASAEPLGGCPSGGGWQLIWSPQIGPGSPYFWGPGAALVDEHGNNDGYACKTVFTADGRTVAQVIDNRVQAGS